MNLSGITALVTGGGRDIGCACAMRLTAAGANVGINYFASSSDAENAAKEIGSDRAIAMQGDMTVESEAKAFVENTANTFGRIDMFIDVTGGLSFS